MRRLQRAIYFVFFAEMILCGPTNLPLFFLKKWRHKLHTELDNMDDHLMTGGLAPKSHRSGKEHPAPVSAAWRLWQHHSRPKGSADNATAAASKRGAPSRRMLAVLGILMVLATGGLTPATIYAFR